MGQDWSRSWRVANPEQLVLTLGAAPFDFKGAGFDSSSNLLFPRSLLGGNRGQTERSPLFGWKLGETWGQTGRFPVFPIGAFIVRKTGNRQDVLRYLAVFLTIALAVQSF